MIPINDRFSLRRDRQNWILVETYTGLDKDKKPKTQKRETYHPWPDTALRHMCELQAQDVNSITEFIGLIESAVELLKEEGTVCRGMAQEIAVLESEVREQASEIKRLTSHKAA